MKNKITKKTKSIYDFNYEISVKVPDRMQSEVMKKLNLFWIGDEHINKLNEDGIMIGKYDNHKNFKKLQNSHYAVCKSIRFKIKIGVTKEGVLFIKGA